MDQIPAEVLGGNPTGGGDPSSQRFHQCVCRTISPVAEALAEQLFRTLDRRITRSFLWINDHQLGFASPRTTRIHTEVSMKRCNACEEEFPDKFSLCPVDGTPLNSLAAALISQSSLAGAEFRIEEMTPPQYFVARRREFKVTMIGGTGLARRLANEVAFVIEQLQRAWPEFERDPVGASARALVEGTNRCKRFILTPNVLAGGVTAILVVLSAIVALLLWPQRVAVDYAANIEEPCRLSVSGLRI
jgi:hypothetical protein